MPNIKVIYLYDQILGVTLLSYSWIRNVLKKSMVLATFWKFWFVKDLWNSGRATNSYDFGVIITLFWNNLAHYASYEFWPLLYDFRQYFIGQIDQQSII